MKHTHPIQIHTLIGFVILILLLTSVSGIHSTQSPLSQREQKDIVTIEESQEHDLGPRLDWYENFDNYTEGIPLPEQSNWEPWGDNPIHGDFYISSNYCRSPPYSLAIDSIDDALHQFSGYTSSYWIFTAWQYIPLEASGASTYFILLDIYEEGGGGDTNWATQLLFDPDDMVVYSEFEGNELPLILGEWVEIHIVIYLEDDVQRIFYNGTLISSKSWTDGVSGDGELNIAAVDFFGNEAEYEVFYDDLSLVEFHPVGACCLGDDSCINGVTEEECSQNGGRYQGHDSFCGNLCCVWGLNAKEIEIPCEVEGDTTDGQDCCPLRDSRDDSYEFVLPYEAEWTFSVCDAGWDTYLYLGYIDPGDIAENNDYPGCGNASKIIMRLGEVGDIYNLVIEGNTTEDYGPYTLVITSRLFADVTGPNGEPDGVVNVYDLLAVLAAWGQTGEPGWIYEDINVDGIVDTADLLELLGSWS